jgi:hypothetical protein
MLAHDQHSTIVGLDVHKESITVAVLPSDVRRFEEIATTENRPRAIGRLVKRVTKKREAAFVYEAGPCGFTLHRRLGCQAAVIAPGLTPIGRASAIMVVRSGRLSM